MSTYLLTGTITTRAPLAYSPPDHVGANKRALLPRMTVPTAAGPMETVYLSGSTIRGRYRHACADVWIEGEESVSYTRYLELKVGGVKGSGEVPRVDLEKRKGFLERDPMLSLFGAGASDIGWIHGRVDIGMALPCEPTEAMVLQGRRGDVTQDPILLEVLCEGEAEKVLLGAQANHDRSQAASRAREAGRRIRRAQKAGEDTTGLERELQEARQLMETAARAQSDQLGSDVSVLLPLPGYEAIPTGIVLRHQMYFRDVSAAQMSLFIAGLARFAADPRFGARRAQGCGRVCVEYVVQRLDGVEPKPVGTILIDPDRWDRGESSLVLTEEPANWLEAWNAPSAAS